MTITEIIQFYQKELERYGDVPIYTEVSDGRATWVVPYTPKKIEKAGENEWPKSRAGRYFVKEY